MRFLKFSACLLVIVLFCSMLAAPIARAQSEGETENTSLATGAGCVLLSVVYGATKLAYAAGGAVVGGLTWVFTGGNNTSAQKVWDASLRGDYYIAPEHLQGEKPIRFVGSSEQ